MKNREDNTQRDLDKATLVQATYQLYRLDKKGNSEPIMVGTQADFYNAPDLARDVYRITAPHHENIMHFGNYSLIDGATRNKLDTIVQAVISGEFLKNESLKNELILSIQDSGLIRANVLYEIYAALAKQPGFIAQKLEELQPILSHFVMLGAEVLPQDRYRKLAFSQLVAFGLDSEAYSYGVLAYIEHDSDDSHHCFGNFQEKIYQHPKANLNALRALPKFGTFLHAFLYFEIPHGVSELIDFFKNAHAREPLNPHKKFDFERMDGLGNTPLHVALNTRNTDAVMALLQLYQDTKTPVGIDVPNRQGLSPLHMAVILGMPEVVEKLKMLGADFNAKDVQGMTVWDYSSLSPEEKERKIIGLLSAVMHPLRANVVTSHQHSELYFFDENSVSGPACLYEEGEVIQSGDAQRPHFVILSNCPPHQERLERVLHILKEKAAAHDPWAMRQLPYVEQQIDEIKHRSQLNALFDLLLELETQAKAGLGASALPNPFPKMVKDHCESLLSTRLSYAQILSESRSFLEKNGHLRDALAIRLQNDIDHIIDETPPVESVFHSCLAGQKGVQNYLNSLKVEEQAFKEAELRHAAALGQVEKVQALLRANVNPNATDKLQRTALHYAVLREYLVENEVYLLADAEGRPKPSREEAKKEVLKSIENRFAVVSALLSSPNIELDILQENKWGQTAEQALIKYIDQGTEATQAINQACYDLLINAPQRRFVMIHDAPAENNDDNDAPENEQNQDPSFTI